MKELFLLRGLPGSGKSTLANSSTRFDHHFEADTYFIYKNGNTSQSDFPCNSNS